VKQRLLVLRFILYILVTAFSYGSECRENNTQRVMLERVALHYHLLSQVNLNKVGLRRENAYLFSVKRLRLKLLSFVFVFFSHLGFQKRILNQRYSEV
jgi:hypothetical protein